MNKIKWIYIFALSFFMGASSLAQVSSPVLADIVTDMEGLYQASVKSMEADLEITLIESLQSSAPLTQTTSVGSDGRTLRNIRVISGLGQIPHVGEKGLALLLCHEVGHILGGKPFKNSHEAEFLNPLFGMSPEVRGRLSSVEGQADDFATRDCLKAWFRDKPSRISFLETAENALYMKKCESQEGVAICKASVNAVEEYLMFLLYQGGFDDDFNPGSLTLNATGDSLAVTVNKSMMFYPETTCRIETLMNGIFELNRPGCWYVH